MAKAPIPWDLLHAVVSLILSEVMESRGAHHFCPVKCSWSYARYVIGAVWTLAV